MVFVSPADVFAGDRTRVDCRPGFAAIKANAGIRTIWGRVCRMRRSQKLDDYTDKPFVERIAEKEHLSALEIENAPSRAPQPWNPPAQ